ncbi:hypothetical protein [Lentibacillus saliphilus]|uniref:hypothetical protein n=1 Tax=Lentibacillus saliphilus TaxID=2737028 RepID=UPI001C30E20A|nr:hypothetical protein [Lentibacillus saliphilus]
MNVSLVMIVLVSGLLIAGIMMLNIKYRHRLPVMTGMMIAMTVGMGGGLLVGLILGITLSDAYFEATVWGMLIGICLGFVSGIFSSLIAVLDGIMSGLMGGMMGTMLGAMISLEYADAMTKVMFFLFVGSLFTLMYMMAEQLQHKGIIRWLSPLTMSGAIAGLFILLESFDTMF